VLPFPSVKNREFTDDALAAWSAYRASTAVTGDPADLQVLVPDLQAQR
jgi:hypothetical protein